MFVGAGASRSRPARPKRLAKQDASIPVRVTPQIPVRVTPQIPVRVTPRIPVRVTYNTYCFVAIYPMLSTYGRNCKYPLQPL